MPRALLAQAGLLLALDVPSIKSLQKDMQAVPADGENLARAFPVVRDLFAFTDKRLILIDKQGVTGGRIFLQGQAVLPGG